MSQDSLAEIGSPSAALDDLRNACVRFADVSASNYRKHSGTTEVRKKSNSGQNSFNVISRSLSNYESDVH